MSCPSGPALLVSCHICGGRNLSTHVDNFYICEACGLGIQAQLPADPSGIYARTEYDKRRVANERTALRLACWARFNHDLTVGRMRLQQIQPFLPKTSRTDHCVINDFGCGTGAFLCAARQAGFGARGVELDPDFCAEVTAITGLRTIQTRIFLDSPAAYPACVLVLNDVLEHLIEPVGVLRRASECLSHHGLIVLEVPDFDACTRPVQQWDHWKPDEHLTAWSAKALDALLRRHFPDFKRVHQANPVPGKLQVCWQRYRDL